MKMKSNRTKTENEMVRRVCGSGKGKKKRVRLGVIAQAMSASAQRGVDGKENAGVGR